MSILIAQGLVSGIVTGCIYALIALSVVIIYKTSEVINFAGGELIMVASYMVLLGLVYFQAPIAIMLVVGPAAMFLLGIAVDKIVLQNVMRSLRPGQNILVSLVIATLGLSYVLRGIVRVVPYTEDTRRLPALIDGPPVFLGPAILMRQDIVIIAITLLVMAALYGFFQHTLVGKALRATSQNARAAVLIGVPVRRMRLLVWGLASGLAGISGLLIGAKLPMTPDMGGQLLLLALAAAIIGGFTNLVGAVVGGMLLGIAQNFVGLFLSSSAMSVAPFVIIMLVLTLRPQGLFGGAAMTKKV